MAIPSMRLPRPNGIDPRAKLRHLLLTVAFCLLVAGLQVAFAPQRPLAPPIAYSLAIGTIIWAVVDLGRHFFPSAQETGWPPGLPGLLLVVGGIATGYVLGSAIADQLCRAFGWYGAAAPMDDASDRRGAILITAMAGVAGTYLFYSINKSRYLERKMGDAQRLANEARLKLLETQLEPHMLFNTLANLRALIAVDPQRAQEMLDHMIAYLRATLDASRTATHPLQSEFDRLRDYLELMAIRMGPRLRYALELPPDLAQHPVPALLLQPLVENCIQHGLEPKVEGGRITVSARRDAGHLLLEVADTGVGTTHAPKAGKGFGLAQVRERLAAVYGDRASLEFTTEPGRGARTVLRLPLDA